MFNIWVLTYYNVLTFKNISADLKDPKENINSNMGDVRGYVLGPQHDTTPDGVITNKNIRRVSSSFQCGHVATQTELDMIRKYIR